MSEPNCHTARKFSENSLATEINKTKVNMHIPNFSVLPILKINKTVMYEFWCDYINSKYEEEANLCYMGTDSFIVNIKTGDVFMRILPIMLKKCLTHQFM